MKINKYAKPEDMAPFITGTQTPNPRNNIILQYNKIPTKKSRKPSFFLPSDHTETTSGKKGGIKKA